ISHQSLRLAGGGRRAVRKPFWRADLVTHSATSLTRTHPRLAQAAPLLIFAVMAVLIVCGGVYGFNAYQASERERHGAELLARVEVQAGHVGSWVTERHQDAHSTAVDPMLSKAFGAAL